MTESIHNQAAADSATSGGAVSELTPPVITTARASVCVAAPIASADHELSAPKARIYSHNLERLKILAMFDIVLLHVGSDAPRLFDLGLPVFLLASLVLPLIGRRPPDLKQFVSRRAQRILLPFAFWSLMYGLLHVYWATRRGSWEVIESWSVSSLVTQGTAYHLWYLPFIFVAGLLSVSIFAVLRKLQGAGAAGVCVAVAMAAALAFSYGTDWLPHHWPSALLAIPLAMAIAMILPHRRAAQAALALAVAAGLGLMSVEAPVLSRYAFAVALVVLVMQFPGRSDPITRTVHKHIYGIYLLHPLVIYGLYSLEAGRHLAAHHVVMGLAVFVVSLIVSRLLQATPLLRANRIFIGKRGLSKRSRPGWRQSGGPTHRPC